MPRTRSLAWSELKIGVLTVVALVITALLIFSLTGARGFLWQRYPLKTRFANVSGLASGSPVRVAGVQVGSVTDVGFAGEMVDVTFEVNKNIRDRITSASVARLGSISLLGGGAVDISPSTKGTPIPDWGYVPPGPTPAQISDITDQASKGIEDISRLAIEVREGRGTVGKLMTDDRLYVELNRFVATAGDLARGVREGRGSVGRLLNDGKKLADRLTSRLDKTIEPQLSHIATDGETYGHHHKHGDMALAFCIDYIERYSKAKLTNYAHFLALRAPSYEVQVHEQSSWSCVHGVERWRNDCGCNTGGKPAWNQRWRKPLRDSLDWLRDELEKIFEREASRILKDPWHARNEYINVILRRNDETIKKFLRDHCTQAVDPPQVLRLMEVQRNAMLMYTSCGWFFDEVSGIETTQIMQYACRAMQLVSQISEINLELEFRKRLEQIPSNVPALSNASNIYTKFVLPSRINLQRVGMHYAVASIFEEDLESFPVFNYSTSNEVFIRKEAGEQKLVLGVTKVRSNTTRSEKKFAFAVIYMGKHNIIGNISLDMEEEKFASMQARMIAAFEEARLGDVIGLMQTYFGPEKYTIWQLFQDEKRKVFNFITYQSMLELEDSLRRIYNRDYPLVMALANNGIPIPNAYRTSFEYILNADLLKCFQTEKINIRMVERVMTELAKWDLRIEDPGRVEHLAGESIFKELKRLSSEGESLKRIERLNRLFPLLIKFNLRPNLYKSQNLYFEISKHFREKENRSPEWIRQFTLLGDNMGVKV